MKQWDIFLFPFSEEQPHPVVILSIDERAAARKHVNGLICVSLRGRPLALHEVLLDRVASEIKAELRLPNLKKGNPVLSRN